MPPLELPSAQSASSSTPRQPGNSVTPKGLYAPFDKPFKALNDKKYLHDRPEKAVFKLLVDCYRLRMDDDSKFSTSADKDSLYGRAPDSIAGFQRFLRRAGTRDGLLPPSWSAEKAEQCVQAGRNGGWSELSKKIAKANIIDHYGDGNMPMQLRYLGGQVLGSSPGGQFVAGMVQIQMMIEGGNSGIHSTRIDASRFMA